MDFLKKYLKISKKTLILPIVLAFVANVKGMEIAEVKPTAKVSNRTINGTFAVLPKEIVIEILKFLAKDAKTRKELIHLMKISQVNKSFRNLFNENSHSQFWSILEDKINYLKHDIYGFMPFGYVNLRKSTNTATVTSQSAINDIALSNQTLIPKKKALEQIKSISHLANILLSFAASKGSTDLAQLALDNGSKIYGPLSDLKDKLVKIQATLQNHQQLEASGHAFYDGVDYESLTQESNNLSAVIKVIEDFKTAQEKEQLIADLKICKTCKKAADQRCSACKEVGYCSRDCQAKDYKNHKTYCVKK